LRAVIFDFDGTLVDSLDAFVEAMAAAVKALGLPPVSRERLAELVRLPADQSLPMLVPSSLNDKSLVERLVSEYRRAYSKLHLRLVRPVPGICSVLRGLKEAGFSIAVITRRRLMTAHVREELEFLGLNGFVDVLATYDTVQSANTKLDLAVECLRKLKLKGGECAVVGDSPEDMEVGKRLKALTIGVLYGFHSKEEIISCNPNFTAERSTEILRILFQYKP